MKTLIKVERAKRDMTQQDLAELVNVSRQTINSIECGRYSPSVQLAIKISNVFKLPVNDIFLLENSD
ncbi:helix-turn-helix transcriptional regulator [Mucilaginibacter achroorhodeus]|uniref:Helix-turn-helix transcriptional regulator n=1 Tax=Mucilaginibacter achroorhodeus TaxID=2599294 RepID=A0A563UAS7_9SPHI|nr:helix-turn-helix transcriptional regulator [Mucilaginibacter achroorhodeus]TWR28481.1 helix-turn-helix transcriptional regulator [Mucilaginibacter achroorhodeus]